MHVVSTAAMRQQPCAAFGLVFNTVVDDRSYLVAVAQGRVEGGNVEFGLEGGECLRHLAERSQQVDPDASVHFAEIGRADRAGDRMREIFEVVEDGAAIMFLCRSAAICDAAFTLLNVHLPPGSVTRH
ncbi:MAG TPA: hypothetical protein VLA16_16775 [Ideonella sp.]|nr:hypothetical protein [Ideonella sp.]